MSQDLQKLREQISASTLLSQIEKAEWIQLLPEMNDAQTAELAGILQSASEHVKKPSILTPAPTAAPHPAEQKQKDLPAGAQLAELETAVVADLPQHQTPPPTPAPAPVPIPPKPTPPPVVPAQPIVHDRPTWQAKLVTPAPTVAVPPTPPHAAPQVNVKTPEDLSKLDLAFLRHGDPEAVLTSLLYAFAAMTKKYPVYELVGKIETSPLYKTYYSTGFLALSSGALSETSKPNELTRKEFEEFTDFRREMDHIIS